MSIAFRGTRVATRSAPPDEPSSTLGAATAGWLALIPCAVLGVVAIVLLGPALGGLRPDNAANSFGFWHPADLRPEPTEQARYALSLVAAMLLPVATAAAWRLQPPLGRRATRAIVAIVAIVQLAIVAFVIACWVGQHIPRSGIVYFSDATLVASGVIAAGVAVIAGLPTLRLRAEAALRESSWRSRLAFAVAIAVTAVWLLQSINTDDSIAWANAITSYHIAFPLDETFAIVNGLTPLVDYSAQYGSLWPYVSALSLIVFGKSLLVYTITMAAICALVLLAIFGVLRRVTHSSVAALLLYLPLLATGSFFVFGTWATRHTFGSYFPSMPLRYGGPFLLAWLVARHLDRDGERQTWPLFLAGGLVVLNNPDFGLAGFGATIAAVLWTARDLRPRALLSQGANVAAGVLGALALLCALTLARAGALPDLNRLVEFPRIYLEAGFALMPMPHTLGLHLIIYATYVAALAVAMVQALERHPNRVLTGMLAWSGVFGLGSASYFAARSGDDTLPITFYAWALALALLTVVAVERIAATPRRVPSIALLAVLYGMGIMVCSLGQTPRPWEQLAHLRHPPRGETIWPYGMYVPPPDREARVFVSSLADGPRRFVVREGAPVAIFAITGHRIADAYGVRNVVPTTGSESIQTRRQFHDALDALRDAGGNTVLMPNTAQPHFRAVLGARGFEVLTARGLRPWRKGLETSLITEANLVKWVDRRHLRPRALHPREAS
jgi:hypothetical protein